MKNFILGFLTATTLSLGGAVYISYVEPDLLLNGRQIHINLSCPDSKCEVNPTIAMGN